MFNIVSWSDHVICRYNLKFLIAQHYSLEVLKNQYVVLKANINTGKAIILLNWINSFCGVFYKYEKYSRLSHLILGSEKMRLPEIIY